MKYATTIITTSVHPIGHDPILSSDATHISIMDDGGGYFVTLQQLDGGTLSFNGDELDLILNTAKQMLKAVEGESLDR